MSEQFTNEELAREAEREAAMRREVYSRKRALGPHDRQRIAMMQEIAARLRELAKKERLL